ncbi:MAG: chain-length determining protein [Anaerococcus sp.]|nr:chain-length determining protein [Anaerococcus sp.]
MKEKRSLLASIPKGLIFGIFVGAIIYFALGFLGFNEYQARSKIITTGLENVDEQNLDTRNYAATINSNKIKQTTLDNLDIDMSLAILDSKLSIEPIEGSAVVDIIVTDTNKLRAEDIADEYADLAVRVVQNIYKTDAQVMEYSYQNAGKVNNYLTYSLIGGLISFVLFTLISMVRTNSYNNKLIKAYYEDRKEIKKDLKDNKDDSNTRVERRVSFKKIEEDDKDPIDEKRIDEDFTKTTIIDKTRIEDRLEDGEYEILGFLPPYNQGDLDV